jgi:hypothetical protein
MLRLAVPFLLLASGCSTARCVELVREAPRDEGISLYVAADAGTVVQAMPGLLRSLHYEIAETRERGTELLAAHPPRLHALARGVRVIIEPSSLVRVTLRRSWVPEAPDLYDARDELVAALRARFGAPK